MASPSDRRGFWIGTMIGLIGLAIGGAGLVISLRPSPGQAALVVLAISSARSDVEKVAAITDAGQRLSEIEILELQFSSLRGFNEKSYDDLLATVAKMRADTEAELAALAAAEDERRHLEAQAADAATKKAFEDRQLLLVRQRKEEAEKEAARLEAKLNAIEQRLQADERICFNKACTDWIIR